MKVLRLCKGVTCLLLLTWTLPAEPLHAEEEPIGFESDRWELVNAQMVDYLGRTCLMGSALLQDVDFENGVIEVDIALKEDVRAYPGIVFRVQSADNYEHVYVRPHRAPFYPDAVQYTPQINGIGCWQLYNGEGYTAATQLPAERWIRLRLEVRGTRARLYIGDGEQPALVVSDLGHGTSRGAIGVEGRPDGSAYFSNFRYEITDDLTFDPPPPIETPPGMFTEWELSQAFRLSELEVEDYPAREFLEGIEWEKVGSEPRGLVNVARYRTRTGREPDCVYARAFIYSREVLTKKINFGYSDAVVVFLNGDVMFLGNSAYRQRDPSFLGIIGLNDVLYLPLKKGANELMFLVVESFGGWGFMCQDGEALFLHGSVRHAWETQPVFLTPESVVFDPRRKVFYVSNYDMYNTVGAADGQFISKVNLQGEVEELQWAVGVARPTGMALHRDRLFVVDRTSIVEIDPGSGEIADRHSVPGAGFINDIAIDDSGVLYVSDSRRSLIYRYKEGTFEEWLSGGEISRPNGIHVEGDRLIVGNNGDRSVKSVDLRTGEVRTITKLGAGVIDGIRTDSNNNYLVSHWGGRIYRVTPAGEVTKLLDLSVPEYNCADFAYVPERGLIVIPTFTDNRVLAYRIEN